MPPPDGGDIHQIQQPNYEQLYNSWLQAQQQIREATQRIQVLEQHLQAQQLQEQQRLNREFPRLTPLSGSPANKRQRTDSSIEEDEELQPKQYRPPPIFVGKRSQYYFNQRPYWQI